MKIKQITHFLVKFKGRREQKKNNKNVGTFFWTSMNKPLPHPYYRKGDNYRNVVCIKCTTNQYKKGERAKRRIDHKLIFRCQTANGTGT